MYVQVVVNAEIPHMSATAAQASSIQNLLNQMRYASLRMVKSRPIAKKASAIALRGSVPRRGYHAQTYLLESK